LKLNDAVFGALFLVLSLLVLWSVQSYPKIPGQNIGPAAFPAVLACLLAVCSVMLIVQGVRTRHEVPWFTRGGWTSDRRPLVAFVVTVGGLALYVALSDRIGFLILGSLMLLALMLALRVRPVIALVVAVLATLLIHVAFYKGLRVPLPWGMLPVLY